jgi:large subunit ribosomal protein L21
MYAVVETGGKQYQVSKGSTLEVERLDAEVGDTIELDRVLLLNDGKVTVGRPLVKGAKVRATVLAQGKARKITVLKYKPKNRYRKKRGHRQHITRIRVDEIVT